MFACPHCNLPGISAWNKFRAGTAIPAICHERKKPSSIGGAILGLMGGIFHLVFLAGAVVSFYLWNWWPLILCAAAYVIVEFLVVKYAPLRKNQIDFAIFAAIFVLLVLVAEIFA